MVHTYKRYRVQAKDRGPLFDSIERALVLSGCTIIRASPHNEAPFRITFEAPGGERMGIVAYAFYANSKLTKNRPDDEWRFQVKYGSKDGDEHEIWQDPCALYTTLFLGISPEHGLFVGADPAIHNPTKFFISVEFKQAHVDEVKRSGWSTWERDRRESDIDPVEVLVGCTAANLLDYVRFERAAQALDQGHRQLLAERWLDERPNARGRAGLESTDAVGPNEVHALAREMEMSERGVLDLIASARRLKMAVRGWVAEEHLARTLQAIEGVSECARSDEEGGPDVTLRYRDSRLLTIQCKNVLRNRDAKGRARMDFQRTRAAKGNPCSRYYQPDDFDLIAACLHAVTEQWEYRFALPHRLDPHKTCVGRLGQNVRIDERWTHEIPRMLEHAAKR